MNELLRGMLLVLGVFLNLGGAAGTGIGTGRGGAAWRLGSEPLSYADRDPSYAIYQRYRYAYDTYGYLFLSSGEAGAEGNVQENSNIPGNLKISESSEIAGNSEMQEHSLITENAELTGHSGLTESLNLAADSELTEHSSITENSVINGSPKPGADGVSCAAATAGTAPALAQLQDYDFLMKHFYSVHASTTASRELMRAETLMGTELKLKQNAAVPQILIYHTHSQETYADYGPGNQAATVVSVGAYLAELLRAKGWNVIHDTAEYDIQGGKLDRSRAYNYALDGITGILQKNPTIQVVLDLHRDGVREGLHLVSEVNGKPTANIMFFQGMSRTPEGAIEYLPNPYLQENLAFAFQMQYLAEGRYPGYTRKIYLKGLRYNLHLRPRSSLIEVGAQTNTLEEAKNAMEPLAELLDTVLRGA